MSHSGIVIVGDDAVSPALVFR